MDEEIKDEKTKDEENGEEKLAEIIRPFIWDEEQKAKLTRLVESCGFLEPGHYIRTPRAVAEAPERFRAAVDLALCAICNLTREDHRALREAEAREFVDDEEMLKLTEKEIRSFVVLEETSTGLGLCRECIVLLDDEEAFDRLVPERAPIDADLIARLLRTAGEDPSPEIVARFVESLNTPLPPLPADLPDPEGESVCSYCHDARRTPDSPVVGSVLREVQICNGCIADAAEMLRRIGRFSR